MEEWVGAAKGKIEIRSLNSCAETDTVDFKILGESFGNASDHVVNDTANCAVKGAVFALLGFAGDDDVSVFALEGDSCRDAEVEFALRAFDVDNVAINIDGDLFRK
jgi:hypothetical protein